VLTLLCIAFFGKSLFALDPRLILALPIDRLLLFLAISTATYTVLLLGVTLGFAHLVQATGYSRASPGEALVIWGKANVAKYLPGNVLHFAGRQILGARFGWPQASIAAASLLEIALQVLLPTALAALALVAFGRLEMLNDLGEWLVVAVVLALGGLTIAAFGRHFRRLLPRLLKPLASLQVARPVELLPAGLWYLLFFLGMSFLAWTLYTLLLGYIQPRDLPILTAAFLISWVMGFVVPGAPGGIGIREGSFAMLGGVFLNTDLLVLVALAMRLVTLLGEGALFLLALSVARQAAHPKAAPATRAEAPSERHRLAGEARRH
jgi:glycosyltransferase 2 family protein